MNSYSLSRDFVDFSFENPTKIKPNHYALFFFAIEHCNRLGWKKEFGLPTTMTMEAIGIKSYNTYSKTFNELCDFGFFKAVERSKNQYSSNIIALLNFDKALDKALDKAFIKHDSKQKESTVQSIKQSIDSIDKQITNNKLTINNKPKVEKEFSTSLLNSSLDEISTEKEKRKKVPPKKNFKPPTINDILDHMSSKLNNIEVCKTEAEKFFYHYESNGWLVGRSKMKNWKAAVSGWITRSNEFKKEKQPVKLTAAQELKNKLGL